MLTLWRWLESQTHWLTFGLAVAGAIVTAEGALRICSKWWREGPGRRRQWIRKFEMLAPGVHTEYVRELFGQPAYQKNYQGAGLVVEADGITVGEEVRPFVEYTWVLANDGYLYVVSNADASVVRYMLTTANRKFRPKIRMGATPKAEPKFVVTLGKTPFSALPWKSANCRLYWCLGARRYGYLESYYYGNPGGYAEWICTFNDAGVGAYSPIFSGIKSPVWGATVNDWFAGASPSDRMAVQQARTGTTVNTVGIGGAADDVSWRCFGADLDSVRMMPRKRRRRDIA